jgi:hypothetical protein
MKDSDLIYVFVHQGVMSNGYGLFFSYTCIYTCNCKASRYVDLTAAIFLFLTKRRFFSSMGTDENI